MNVATRLMHSRLIYCNTNNTFADFPHFVDDLPNFIKKIMTFWSALHILLIFVPLTIRRVGWANSLWITGWFHLVMNYCSTAVSWNINIILATFYGYRQYNYLTSYNDVKDTQNLAVDMRANMSRYFVDKSSIHIKLLKLFRLLGEYTYNANRGLTELWDVIMWIYMHWCARLYDNDNDATFSIY